MTARFLFALFVLAQPVAILWFYAALRRMPTPRFEEERAIDLDQHEND